MYSVEVFQTAEGWQWWLIGPQGELSSSKAQGSQEQVKLHLQEIMANQGITDFSLFWL